jgi:predicted Zn-dependent protease with MMP-like domain
MAKVMGAQQQIIMNYSVPPGAEEIEVIASAMLDSLPEELMEFCEGLAVKVEDFPDESTVEELDLEDPYDLLAQYKSGKEISPGVQKKTANDDDILLIYRRPLLDMWCESCDDLMGLLRQVMIEELGRNFDFSDEEIEEMGRRHYQGML